MEKQCVACGKLFSSTREHKICCSSECLTKYKKTYQRDYKRRMRAANNIKKCKVCGKEFKSNYGIVTCSNKCKLQNIKNRYINNDSVTYTKTCKICGKPFESKRQEAKYCSSECRLNAKRLIARLYQSSHYIKRGIIMEKQCVVCGKLFSTNTKSRICCSKECSDTRIREKAKLRKRLIAKDKTSIVKTCSVCGKTFSSKSKNGKYCSDECRNRHFKLYLKEYQANLRATKKKVKICPICGKEFSSPNRRITCSDECKVQYTKNYNKQYYSNIQSSTQYTKTCSVCGKTFISHHPISKYCSVDCRIKGSVAYKKDYYLSKVKPSTKSKSKPSLFYSITKFIKSLSNPSILKDKVVTR